MRRDAGADDYYGKEGMLTMKKNNTEEVITPEIADSDRSAKVKKFKYGSMSMVSMILVVAIVLVINVMVNIMGKRTPMKIDLTPDKRYDLSDETIDILKNLDKNVEIMVTMPRSTFATISEYYEYQYKMYFAQMGQTAPPMEFPYEMIPVILDKYEMYSKQGSGEGSVSVRYVDLNTDPDAISKYSKNYNGEISKGCMVFSSGDKVRVLSETDIQNMLMPDQSTVKSGIYSLVFAGESTITSNIMNVIDSHIVNVAFVKTMSGEPIYRNDYADPIATLRDELLSKNGYVCTDVDIAKDELDTEKYDMVVLPMPMNDFSEEIISKLGDFLYNNENYGKNMLYIPDLAAINLTNIDEFLADWSIKVEPWVLADQKNVIGNVPTNIVLSIGDKDSVGELPNESLPIIAPYTREISVLTKNNQSVVKEVLKSSDESGPYSILDEDAELPEAKLEARNVGVKSSKEHAVQLDVYRSSIFVLGSSFFTNSEYITRTSTYNNANVLLNILNTMTGKENGAVIPEKALQSAVIAPTKEQSNGIKAILIAIPALVAVAGLVVLIRRRNR